MNRDSIKHRILKALYDNWLLFAQEHPGAEMNDEQYVGLGVAELIKVTKLSEQIIREYCFVLEREKSELDNSPELEIIKTSGNPQIDRYRLCKYGRQSAINNYFSNLAKEKRLNLFKDIILVSVAFLSLVASVIIDTVKDSKNTRIINLEKKVDSLEQKYHH